jgi:glyceraldehyde-3-phosphate dehydrogenase (NAD(P)+) (phosphorylating)
VLDAFRHVSRVAFILASDGITALNSTAELMKELGPRCGDMWEVALWEDILTVEGCEACEAYYAYQVDNQAIVIPETVDAIRALSGRERNAQTIYRADERSAWHSAKVRLTGRLLNTKRGQV